MLRTECPYPCFTAADRSCKGGAACTPSLNGPSAMLPQPRSILQYGSDEFAEPAVSSALQVIQQGGAPPDGADGTTLQVLRFPCCIH